MLERKKSHNSTGFTILELLAAVTILAILAGAAVPSMAKQVEKAREAAYRKEAEAVFQAVRLYLLEKDAEGKIPQIMDVFEDLIKPLSDKNHILRPYLSGKITKGGRIFDLSYSGTLDSLEEIGYRADGYEIQVTAGGSVTVLKRPGGKKRK